MDCPKCGAPNLEGASNCSTCGSSLSGGVPQAATGPPPDAWAPQPPTPPAPPTPAAPPAGEVGSQPPAQGYGQPPAAPFGQYGQADQTPAYGQTSQPVQYGQAPPAGQYPPGAGAAGPYGQAQYGQTPYGAPPSPYGSPFGAGQYAQPAYGGPRPSVPNYLVWSILATLFCCLPAGVVSIVYAAQVNGKLDEGDYQTARKYSANARTWAMVSAGVGLVAAVLYVVLIFGLGVFGTTTTSY